MAIGVTEEKYREMMQHITDMESVLRECADYFDNRSDVLDGPEGTQRPNREMQMLQRIEEVL